MRLYSALSRLSFLNRYSYKFLFIAFVGIHLPLLSAIVLLFIRRDPGTITVVLCLLFATLIATALTLVMQHCLTIPIQSASRALVRYRTNEEVPALPTDYHDEAGVLMSEVQRTLTQLDGLLAEKRDLVSLVSHDVRGPIGTAIQLLDLMGDEQDPGEKEAYRQALRTSLAQQYRLVENVLALLRSDAPSATYETMEWSELLERITLDLRPLMRRKGVEVVVEGPGSPLRIQTELLPQAFKNVLYNALKFSKPGGSITLRSSRTADRLRVEVADQGLGFDPAHTEALFDRFTKHRRKGTAGEATVGLGLYLSRRIVAQHGGTLTARSDGPDQGATFVFELPVDTDAVQYLPERVATE
ncbi:MAG: HAMP domain-containing sensor histidine kinase [Catalinimonas sp.]